MLSQHQLVKLIGKRIQELRVEQNMSQEQLSFTSHVSRSHISQVETGNKTPSVYMLYKLSLALKIPLNVLFKY
jgi:XRE family transcriptional regulator, regulator of sulfur utilization